MTTLATRPARHAILCTLLISLPAFSANVPPTEKKAPEPGQKQIEFSASKVANVRRARELKATGDYEFEKKNYETAASLYLRALTLAPDAFTTKDKQRIAERLVTAGRRKEAIEVLRQLANERGRAAEFRVQIAKLLSANEDYDAAIKEVDDVLARDRGNKFALLAKANFLRTQQKYAESADIYRKILESGEDFDARIGLTYSLLAMGEKTRARDSFASLKPEDDDQREQMEGLKNHLESVTHPAVDLYSDTFTDSDNNRNADRRATIRGTGTDWDLSATYSTKTAESEGVEYTADTLSASASANFSEILRLAFTAGRVTLGAATTKDVTISDVTADMKVGFSPPTRITVSISHSVLTASGYQIANFVELHQSSLRYTRAIDSNTTVYLNYKYQEYSDSNSANDFQGSGQYTLYRAGPIINAGYAFRHMNFRRPAFNGYFDPQDYYSNQVFLTLYYENAWIYFDSEVDYGRQRYSRNFFESHDAFIYASASLGTTSFRKARVELHSEYNRSKPDKLDFEYHDLLVSARLSYIF